MSGEGKVRRALPWVLCAISLTLYGITPWLWWLLRNQPAPGQVSWLDATILAIGVAGIPVVGAMIASRQPASPYGWLWCTAGVAFGVSNAARPLVRVVGLPRWGASVLESWGVLGLTAMLTFVFLLFPDGRLPGARWRWVARTTIATALLLMIMVTWAPYPDPHVELTPWALHGAAARLLGQIIPAGVVVLSGLVVASMASLVLRYRRAGPVARRQLTWFLYAAGLNAVLIGVGALAPVPEGPLSTAVYAVGFGLLPVAVGVAVLRYRLFEIDRIVSRTVSYGLLTAGLIGTYLLVVALLRPLLEPVTGSSALAVAGSTLAVAAAFNPARKRLQGAVDRRFDRARYDATRAVDAFATRLRNQVDLDQITNGLCETVDATVAPGRVAVWLRSPERGRSP